VTGCGDRPDYMPVESGRFKMREFGDEMARSASLFLPMIDVSRHSQAVFNSLLNKQEMTCFSSQEI
jgi:hypothetical protein